MSIKLRYFVLLFFLFALSCAKTGETFQNTTGREVVLRLCPAGELLNVSDEPLSKANLPEGTLYAVSVFSSDQKYAHGVFDDPSAMQLRLIADQEYSIRVKAVKAGVSEISHDVQNYMGAGVLDNTFHYYATDATDEAYYSTTSDITSWEGQWLLDTYYGALSITATAQASSLSVNLYRMMHTLRVHVVGFEDGDGTATFTQSSYLPGTTSCVLSFAAPEYSVSAVICTDFDAVLSAIVGGGDYSRTTTFSAEYTSTVYGSPYAKTLLDAQPLTVYRNRVNTLTYNLRHNYLDPPVPEAVDLGLSVKWASFNVGASKPEEYGDYYAWGEVETKVGYSWNCYVLCDGSEIMLTKYNVLSDYGDVDNMTVLEAEDDVARKALGGEWRMPTDAEWTELRESCTWTWTTLNGVYGRQVTSNVNNNSIFLPAAGYMDNYNYISSGSHGTYWSSSLFIDNARHAWYVDLHSGNVNRGTIYRYVGLSVRPVLKENSTEKVGEIDGEW